MAPGLCLEHEAVEPDTTMQIASRLSLIEDWLDISMVRNLLSVLAGKGGCCGWEREYEKGEWVYIGHMGQLHFSACAYKYVL